MRNWSDSPFEREVPLSEVNPYTDDHVISRDNGESSVIYESPRHEGWLVKLYKPETKVDRSVLSRLISLPSGMPAADLAIVDGNVSWPVARVVDGYRTVGTVMAKAPPEYSFELTLIGGRIKTTTIEVDHLANPSERIRRLGIPVPSAPARLIAMRNLIRVAALFERYDVVYGDWSFANAFWSPSNNTILIIDMDSAGIGRRRFVETPNWEDPLVAKGEPLTTHTDRYKVALLVARAASGLRKEGLEAVEAVAAQYPSYPYLAELLRKSISAASLGERPLLADLDRALNHGGANVIGSVPWDRPSRHTQRPTRSPPAAEAGRLASPDPAKTAVSPHEAVETFVGCVILLALALGLIALAIYLFS